MEYKISDRKMLLTRKNMERKIKKVKIRMKIMNTMMKRMTKERRQN